MWMSAVIQSFESVQLPVLQIHYWGEHWTTGRGAVCWLCWFTSHRCSCHLEQTVWEHNVLIMLVYFAPLLLPFGADCVGAQCLDCVGLLRTVAVAIWSRLCGSTVCWLCCFVVLSLQYWAEHWTACRGAVCCLLLLYEQLSSASSQEEPYTHLFSSSFFSLYTEIWNRMTALVFYNFIHPYTSAESLYSKPHRRTWEHIVLIMLLCCAELQ